MLRALEGSLVQCMPHATLHDLQALCCMQRASSIHMCTYTAVETMEAFAWQARKARIERRHELLCLRETCCCVTLRPDTVTTKAFGGARAGGRPMLAMNDT